MNLFTSPLDAERLGRATDPATRAADRDAALAATSSEGVALIGGTRRIAYMGSETPRERVWLQFDACGDDLATAIAEWSALESLTADRPASLRTPVLGRARLAVVLSEQTLARSVPRTVPILDAAALGAHPPLLDALRRFAPSLIIHVQDWSAEPGHPLAARLVESFRLDPALHGALPSRGGGRVFSRARRAHRAAATSPDWAVGTRAADYARRMGAPFRELGPARDEEQPDRHAVHEIAPGRFVPALPYRRLGGGNLGEVALATCGAHGITVQLRGGAALERAGLALAFAEGAIVHRMGLQPEGAE